MKEQMDPIKLLYRLKDEYELEPWEIEAWATNYFLIDLGYVKKKDIECLREIVMDEDRYLKIVSDMWFDDYVDTLGPEMELDNKVKEAMIAGLEDYTCANLCIDFLWGVSDYWYDDVINDYMDDVGDREAVFNIYIKYHLGYIV